MSPIRRAKAVQFAPLASRRATTLLGVKHPALHPYFSFSALVALMCCAMPVAAQDDAVAVMDSAQAQVAKQLISQAALGSVAPGARVDVQVGQIDTRLRLAPCLQTEAYLPAGQRLLGKTRVGLRCVKGPSLWNVTLPVTVSVFAPAMVSTAALPAGTRIKAEHLRSQEIDWGAASGGAFVNMAGLIGRELARPLPAASPVQASDLRQRQWFLAGETVRVLGQGAGFAIATEGQALSHGIEGQAVRVRTESGRVFTGRAVSDHQVEIAL